MFTCLKLFYYKASAFALVKQPSLLFNSPSLLDILQTSQLSSKELQARVCIQCPGRAALHIPTAEATSFATQGCPICRYCPQPARNSGPFIDLVCIWLHCDARKNRVCWLWTWSWTNKYVCQSPFLRLVVSSPGDIVGVH